MTFRIEEVESITPQSNLIHPHFKDLVNNFVYYHKMTNSGDQKVWTNPPPTYSSYQSIMELKDDIINHPESYLEKGPITVRCLASHLYTCDAELHGNPNIQGYDRLYKYDEIKHKAGQFMLDRDGFSAKSDTLHGMARWLFDKNGKVSGFIICKDRGNLRTHIGIASVGGGDVELLITLDFHEIDPNIPVDDLIAIESETFTEDAMDRRGFDSSTKFRSGFKARRKRYVVQAEFLDKELKVDFADVINTERLSKGLRTHRYSLSSLQKLDFGKEGNPTGYITRYGRQNIINAVEILKEILKARNGDRQISISAIHTFAKTFHFLCETPATLGIKNNARLVNPVSTVDNIKAALLDIFTQKTRHQNFIKDMKALSKTSADKDTTWFGFKSYMALLLKDLREVNNRSNDYRATHPCIQAYINDISENHLRAEATKIVSSDI